MAKQSRFYFWDWDKDPDFEGTLTGKIPNFPPFKKYVFVFATEKGGIVHSWAFVQMRKVLMHANFGTQCKIHYGGKVEDPDTGRLTRVFDVQITGSSQTFNKKEVKNKYVDRSEEDQGEVPKLRKGKGVASKRGKK